MRRLLRFSSRIFFFVLVLPPLFAIAALAARGRLFDADNVLWLAVAWVCLDSARLLRKQLRRAPVAP